MGEVVAFPKSPQQHWLGPATREPEPLWRELVGRELRQERTRQARTLADVAGEAGISVQYLSEVERGLKEPSSEVLGAVHGALGLRLVDLTLRVSRELGHVTGPLALAR
ncbi:helix-turn-helix domain-containing protein [Nocardioides rubriscoriae]|uniref:helix-turn-helix domain-containing protein n=1 Tax=Nocardioides rubriscoriae TaxID=642762 RepID=UPI0011DF5CF4|nr:helix-turn-helix transcriptional regulator [Nocardioides rubriscoriae]